MATEMNSTEITTGVGTLLTKTSKLRVLVIAPHNDDEILGVGGTMVKLSQQGHEVIVCEVTAGSLDDPIVQMQKQEALRSHVIVGAADTVFMDLPVVGLREMQTKEINKCFLETITKICPDIAFIPHMGDLHFDHRMVVEAAMVALRPVSSPQLQAIYAYETLSETEWNLPNTNNAFLPNVYCDISEVFPLKIEAMKCHASQVRTYPHPRSLEAIEALARYRGSTVCRRYAEAFMTIRAVW